ncbi:PREDICTED: probable purine permease 14 [Tarenaya hassleriana]|uniref:probable purine permease 14 n=1 Tax=Tarenaya hassleriana TaxID=28532 RepID=UPI00053C3731|nr:PREDICTED: probable purine permease 14 [Tarenaya hassleriana]
MAQNHQPHVQTKQDEFVEIPMNIERGTATLINQTGGNRKKRQWVTIVICISFVVIGQSIARLLENFYYDQTHRLDYDDSRQYDGAWTQSLLQSVGFPLLIIPFLLFPSRKQSNPPPITSDRPSVKYLAIIYPCLGITMAAHGRLSATAKLSIPFGIFTLIYTTQLFFTSVFSRIINKTRFNRWIFISLAFAIATGALTLSTSFGGEPDEAEESWGKGSWSAFFAAVIFSLLLCNVQNAFDSVISKRDEASNRKPSFAVVMEMLTSPCLAASVMSAAALLISGEQHDLRREMEGFSKGKASYVLAMAGQAAAWQIYWVGIVGLVFVVSCVFSNIISVITWPIVSALVVVFFNFMDDDFDAFKGAAFATAVLSISAYVYKLKKEEKETDDSSS